MQLYVERRRKPNNNPNFYLKMKKTFFHSQPPTLWIRRPRKPVGPAHEQKPFDTYWYIDKFTKDFISDQHTPSPPVILPLRTPPTIQYNITNILNCSSVERRKWNRINPTIFSPFEDSCSLLKDSEPEVKHCTPFISITDHEAEQTANKRAFVSDSVSFKIFLTQYTCSWKAPLGISYPRVREGSQ